MSHPGQKHFATDERHPTLGAQGSCMRNRVRESNRVNLVILTYKTLFFSVKHFI